MDAAGNLLSEQPIVHTNPTGVIFTPTFGKITAVQSLIPQFDGSTSVTASYIENFIA